MARLPTLGNTTRPRSKGFHAAIGDLLVRLAPGDDTPYAIIAPESEPPRVNTGQSAEEFIGTDGQVYARADFTGGEGLAWAHRVDPGPNDIRRFWASTNVIAPVSDPGKPLYIQMSYAWRLWDQASDIVTVATFPVTENVAIVSQASVAVLAQLDADVGPTLVANPSLPSGGPAYNAAGLGDRVYVVNGTTSVDWVDTTGATGTDTAPGGSWVSIWEAKGRLFLAEALGGSLWEWQPGTDPVEVTAERTIHPTQQWTTVIDAGAYIAAGATDGSVYFFAPASLEDPTLVLYSSSPMPEDEAVVEMAFNQGVMLIGTEEINWDDDDPNNERLTGRLYTARITDILANVELVKRWDDIEQPVPRNMATTRDSIFFTTQDGGNVEVWRMLLPTLGLFREDEFPVTGDVVGFANPGQVGTLATATEVWLETRDATEEQSWLTMAGADFFTASSKAWNELRVAIARMPPNGEVIVRTSTEVSALADPNDRSWVTRRVVREDVKEVRIALTGVNGRYLFVQLGMVRGSDRVSPQVVSVTAIGRTDDEEQVEYRLPVIVSDQIERPYRKPVRVNGYGNAVRQRLFDLKGDSLIVRLYRPDVEITGTVTAVQAIAPYINRRGHVLDVAQVVVRGTRRTSEAQSLTGGPGSLGVGLLGVRPNLGGINGQP